MIPQAARSTAARARIAAGPQDKPPGGGKFDGLLG
jgi:hypothetical protein